MIDNKNKEYRIAKKCPACGWRLLDKVSPASGIIELKCPKCGTLVRLNLSFRSLPAVPRKTYRYNSYT